MIYEILIGTDQDVAMTLQDPDTLEYINDATGTARVLTRAGDEVAGEDWPVDISYIPDSDGEYLVPIPHTLILSQRRTYYIEVVATAGADQKTWLEPVKARYARFGE